MGYLEKISSVNIGNLVCNRYPTSLMPPLTNPKSIARSPHTLAPTHGVTVS